MWDESYVVVRRRIFLINTAFDDFGVLKFITPMKWYGGTVLQLSPVLEHLNRAAKRLPSGELA
jgi:hypothetical protein